MHKTLFLLFFMLAFTAAGCQPKVTTNGSTSSLGKDNASGQLTSFTDTCAFINADTMYSAWGKPVAHIDHGIAQDPAYCTYYSDYSVDFHKLPNGKTSPGGHWISLKLSDLSVDNQKKGNEFLGYKLSEDIRIAHEHFIVTKENGDILSIYLIINPNRFLDLSRSGTATISNDDLIVLASRLARFMDGRADFQMNQNPTKLMPDEQSKPEDDQTSDKPTQRSAAQDFWSKLASSDVQGALDMMDANAQTKKLWETNFKTIQSLKVISLEPTFQDEWTADRQTYKATLDVSVTAQGQGLGWSNGQNLRWITLQNEDGKWLVHEIANNP